MYVAAINLRMLLFSFIERGGFNIKGGCLFDVWNVDLTGSDQLIYVAAINPRMLLFSFIKRA